LKTIVYAGTQLTSFAQGSAALEALGRLNVATKQVKRITEKNLGRNVSNNATMPFKRLWRCR
jgi:hypothetical protein